MASKVKILPSDVLLLMMDYLDSPTMMNCREVCKSWLDVVDGNRSLWDYFYVSNEKNRSTTLKMLKTFSSKSNHSIKAFELLVDPQLEKKKPSEKLLEKGNLYDEKRLATAEVIRTLLQSKKSLKVWSNRPDESDSDLITLFVLHLYKFQNLKSFCGVDHSGLQISSKFPYQSSAVQSSLPNGSLPSLLRVLLKFQVSMSLCRVLQASTSTLVHLKLDVSALAHTGLKFPKLRILELVGYTESFPKRWSSPKLQFLSVDIKGLSSDLVIHFPSSIEEIAVETFLPSRWISGGFRKRGLNSLKRCYPKVEKLRFDSNVKFIPAEVIGMVQARKEAFEKGFEVEGVQLKPIKTLTLDLKKLQPAELSQLQKLVPEVVDVGNASREVVVDC